MNNTEDNVSPVVDATPTILEAISYQTKNIMNLARIFTIISFIPAVAGEAHGLRTGVTKEDIKECSESCVKQLKACVAKKGCKVCVGVCTNEPTCVDSSCVELLEIEELVSDGPNVAGLWSW